jgi:hypothetical protein
MAENARLKAILFIVQLSNSRANCNIIRELNRYSLLLVIDNNSKEAHCTIIPQNTSGSVMPS